MAFTNVPYTGIYDEYMTKYYINGKVVRTDSVMYERIKRSNKPYCLQTKEDAKIQKCGMIIMVE